MMQLFEQLEVMLEGGNSINPDSVIRSAIQLTIGKKVNNMEKKTNVVHSKSPSFDEAIGLIIKERVRQLNVEGWSIEHDDNHDDSSLAYAAMCYTMPVEQRYSEGVSNSIPHDYFPWEHTWWKPSPENRIKELVKAGALIVAEIERLQRKEK